MKRGFFGDKKGFWEGSTDFGSNAKENKKFAKKWFFRFLFSLILLLLSINLYDFYSEIWVWLNMITIFLGIYTFFSFMVLISHLLILKQEHARYSLRNEIVNYTYTILFFAILFGLWSLLF